MHEIMSFYLDNGLQVVMNNIPRINTVVVGMWIKQGSKNETSQNNGISHITEHMVFNGNNSKNKELVEILKLLRDKGVSYNATTTKENTYYYFQGLKENLGICLDALKLMTVSNRCFDVELFENELKIVESEASSFYSSFNQINERTSQALYGDFGIGKIIVGKMNNIRSTTLSDVERLISSTYTPENSILVVMGNIDYNADAIKIENKFNSWEDNDTLSVEECIDNEPGVYFDGHLSGTNAVMSIGFRIPYFDEKERICVELISLILSDPVMSERIPFEVRQRRGLAYNVGGFFYQYKKMCTLGIACTSLTSNIDEIVKIILSKIKEAQIDGISEVELNRAKMNLITKRNFEFSEPLKRTLYLGKHSTYGYLYSFEDEIRKIKKIDIDYINNAVKKFLCVENMGLALIGNVDIEKIVDNLYI